MPVEGRGLSSRRTQQVARDRGLGNLSTPKTVQKLQMALHAKAKAEAGYRFYTLYDKFSREDILAHAYAQCRPNKGAPGVDGQDFADILTRRTTTSASKCHIATAHRCASIFRTPGTKDMTGYIYQAFATDLNDRIRDNGRRSLEALVEVHDIDIPQIAGFKSPNETPSPRMEPFKVFEDDRVRVSATLVAHAPVWPAFAFRFDTDDGSIVFSGDTARSENLIKLAKGADILVHEVIVTRWVNGLFPTPRSVAEEGLMQHLLS